MPATAVQLFDRTVVLLWVPSPLVLLDPGTRIRRAKPSSKESWALGPAGTSLPAKPELLYQLCAGTAGAAPLLPLELLQSSSPALWAGAAIGCPSFAGAGAKLQPSPPLGQLRCPSSSPEGCPRGSLAATQLLFWGCGAAPEGCPMGSLAAT